MFNTIQHILLYLYEDIDIDEFCYAIFDSNKFDNFIETLNIRTDNLNRLDIPPLTTSVSMKQELTVIVAGILTKVNDLEYHMARVLTFIKSYSIFEEFQNFKHMINIIKTELSRRLALNIRTE